MPRSRTRSRAGTRTVAVSAATYTIPSSHDDFEHVHRGRLCMAAGGDLTTNMTNSEVSNPTWRTSNGEEVPIKEMESRHLWNTIRRMNEQSDGSARRRGPGRHHPMYSYLLTEAAKRGLCLNMRPEISGMSQAVNSMRKRRTTSRPRLPDGERIESRDPVSGETRTEDSAINNAQQDQLDL